MRLIYIYMQCFHREGVVTFSLDWQLTTWNKKKTILYMYFAILDAFLMKFDVIWELFGYWCFQKSWSKLNKKWYIAMQKKRAFTIFVEKLYYFGRNPVIWGRGSILIHKPIEFVILTKKWFVLSQAFH